MRLRISVLPGCLLLFLVFASISDGNCQQLRGVAGMDGNASANGTASRIVAEDSFNNTAFVEVIDHRELEPCSGYFCQKYFDEICIIMTHNSHAVAGDSWSPNQYKSERAQMKDGIRGFAMDIYEDNGKLTLKHGKSDPLGVDYPQRVREILSELASGRYKDDFFVIQFETYVSEEGIRKVCEAWGNKIILNFDRSKMLGEYIAQGRQVLLFTDHGNAMSHLGMHKSAHFIAENNYRWTDSRGSPNLAWRRGPKGGNQRYAKMMSYFCSKTGIGNPLTSRTVNDPGRMLYHARQYMKQGYAQGQINIIMVDFYNEGNPFAAQQAIRDGSMFRGCLGDGSSCSSGTSCYKCCAERHEWWDSKGGNACGKEPCWKSGRTADFFVTKRNCCRGAHCPWYWFGVCKCN
mmetsp:Transcript_29297/g.86784  ORF Transcript_29297/g.86784 Transcript_29297/m.86784 type:complete len:404 (-) Transcript_29297:71-1282(-)